MKLTVREAARLLNAPEKSVYRWIKQGLLPAYRINDQYRINRAELLEWATSRKISVSPTIFEEPEGGDAAPPTLEEALRAGGIHYRVSGHDKASVLHAVVDIMSLPDDQQARLHVGQASVRGEEFASLTPVCPQVHLFEREIAEQFGLRAVGHPWFKPVRYHRSQRRGYEAFAGPDGSLPVDLYVPGCPPHPLTILDGLLRLLGRIR